MPNLALRPWDLALFLLAVILLVVSAVALGWLVGYAQGMLVC